MQLQQLLSLPIGFQVAQEPSVSAVTGLHKQNMECLRLLDGGMADMQVGLPLPQIVWSDLDARA